MASRRGAIAGNNPPVASLEATRSVAWAREGVAPSPSLGNGQLRVQRFRLSRSCETLDLCSCAGSRRAPMKNSDGDRCPLTDSVRGVDRSCAALGLNPTEDSADAGLPLDQRATSNQVQHSFFQFFRIFRWNNLLLFLVDRRGRLVEKNIEIQMYVYTI